MAGYIGSKASVVSSGAERKKTFAITTSTTSLTGLVYTPTKVHVFHNGVRLVDGTDFTATNSTSITLTVAAESGDQVVVVSYASFQVADAYTQTEADAEFVAKAGDTMTGSLVGVTQIGIGTSSTNRSLTIEDGDVQIHETGTSNDPLLNFSVGGTQASPTQSWSMRIDNSDGDKFQLMDVTDSRIVLTADGSGKVGINTAAPSNPLTVDGDNNSIRIRYSGNTNYRSDYAVASNGQTTINSYKDGDNQWQPIRLQGSVVTHWTSGSERMRLDASGNLLLGQSSLTAIDTSSTTTGYSFRADGRAAITRDSGIALAVNRLTNDGDLIEFKSDGTAVGSISVSGSSTAYNTSSDYRLKTDAQPMTGASARVQALNPVNFEWLSDGTRVDGFLAHEAATVVPESVTGTKDAMQDEEYEVTPAVLDDDGNETTPAVMGTRSVPDYQGIDQSKLVPLLTAALQEALNKIDTMETRLAALEGN